MNEQDRKKIKDLPKVSQYQSKIRNQGLGTFGFSLNSDSAPVITNDGTAKKMYDELLKEKVQDEQMRKLLIKNSEETLRKRTSMHVVISGKTRGSERTEGALQIIGINPSDLEEVREYFMNKTIPSNEFNNIVQGFTDYMSEKLKPIEGTIPLISTQEVVKIDKVEGAVEFQ